MTCSECGQSVERLACAPAIHTLETHFRGYRGEEGGHFVPSFGEYRDPNLTDEAGNPLTYSSTKEKRKLLEARGLYELPPRKKEAQIFGKKGRNRKTDKQTFTQKRAR